MAQASFSSTSSSSSSSEGAISTYENELVSGSQISSEAHASFNKTEFDHIVCDVQASRATINPSLDSSNGNGNQKEDLEELEDMDPGLASQLVLQFGAFKTAKHTAKSKNVDKSESSDSNDQKLPELPDMDEKETNAILSTHGGFARSAATTTSASIHVSSSVSKQLPEIMQKVESTTARINNASQTESLLSSGELEQKAQNLHKVTKTPALLRKTLHKPQSNIRSTTAPRTAHLITNQPRKQTLHTPKPTSQTQSLPLSAAGSTSTTTATTATATSSGPASLFPSRKDVLSARRALKSGSNFQIRSPSLHFKTPSKVRQVNPDGNTPLSISQTPSIRTSKTINSPSGPHRRLSFKSPTQKRPLTILPFVSPSKRVAKSNINSTNKCGAHQQIKYQTTMVEQSNESTLLASPLAAKKTDSSSVPTPQPSLVDRGTNLPQKFQLKAPSYVFNLNMDIPRVKLGGIADKISMEGGHEASAELWKINSKNAKEYRFQTGTDDSWGAAEARQAMIANGCATNYVSERWVGNHFRWIVWNCACYARRIPSMAECFWSSGEVLNRLLYRYEREYVRGERSALKRILEMDSPSQQLIVLCVASIITSENVTQVEVTDGWYSLNGYVDSVLAGAISRGHLRVGCKIVCSGLRIAGLDEGAEPLSAKAEDASVMLNANCTRRARWDTRLGFQRGKSMFMSLSAIHESGGPIGATLDVLIVRRYPMLYMETMADGKRVIRSQKEEEKINDKYTSLRTTKALELIDDLRANLINPNPTYTTDLDTGSDAQGSYGLQMETNSRYVEEKQKEIEITVAETLNKEQPQRQVKPLFKLLVCDYPAHEYKNQELNQKRHALVTIWSPRGIQPSNFPEGSRFLFTGLTIASSKKHTGHIKGTENIRLNFSSSSQFRPMPVNPQIANMCSYYERGVLCVDELRHVNPGDEVDVCGKIEGYTFGSYGQMSILYLSTTDEDGVLHNATITFSSTIFGRFNFQVGKQALVRNCMYVHADKDTRKYTINASELAEFSV